MCKHKLKYCSQHDVVYCEKCLMTWGSCTVTTTTTSDTSDDVSFEVDWGWNLDATW